MVFMSSRDHLRVLSAPGELRQLRPASANPATSWTAKRSAGCTCASLKTLTERDRCRRRCGHPERPPAGCRTQLTGPPAVIRVAVPRGCVRPPRSRAGSGLDLPWKVDSLHSIVWPCRTKRYGNRTRSVNQLVAAQLRMYVTCCAGAPHGGSRCEVVRCCGRNHCVGVLMRIIDCARSCVRHVRARKSTRAVHQCRVMTSRPV